MRHRLQTQPIEPLPVVSSPGAPKAPGRKTRTLYVREEDQEIWDAAKEIVGDSLSTHITNHLRKLVEERRLAQKGFERIIVKLTQDGRPQAKAFYGRWIITPENPMDIRESESHPPDFYALAVTQKNNVVMFNFGESDFDYPTGAFSCLTLSRRRARLSEYHLGLSAKL